MPAAACTACNHPDRASIDAGLLAGQGVRTLAKRFGLSKSALSRHRPHATGEGVPAASGGTGVPGREAEPAGPTPEHAEAHPQSPPGPTEEGAESHELTPQPRGKVTPRQRLALAVIFQGGTYIEAGAAAGVHEATVRGWLYDDDAFRREHDRLAREQQQRTEALIFSVVPRAVRVVNELLAKPKTQVEGARIGLGNAVRLAARYKHLQVEGYAPAPMFILPEGARISTVRVIPEIPPQPKLGPIIEAEGHPVDEEP